LKRKKAPTVDISLGAEALGFLSEGSWETTPTAVRHFIIEREKAGIEDKKTIAELSKIWLNESFALEFCDGRKVKTPEMIRANFVLTPYL